MFLGSVRPPGVNFRTPGPVHHARVMRKLFETFKNYVFRKQFKLTAKEEKGFKDLCLFGILIYIEAWFTAPIAKEAPRRDLKLAKSISKISNFQSILQQALKAPKSSWPSAI